MNHVFGPVPSRRLGRSLGVDLVPFKTCSYDCIYCQLGRTTNKTIERREWTPIDAVLDEVKEEFPGEIWLEVFILGGYTADALEAGKIDQWVRRIKPGRVQINTVTRPPAESFAVAVNRGRLEELARLFEPEAEVIADFRGVHAQADFTATRDTVLQLLERRPCSLDDVAEGLGIHRNEAVKYIEELLASGSIEAVRSSNRVYYRVSPVPSQATGGNS